jgi:hypothetical protein
MNYQKAIDDLNSLMDVESNQWAQESVSCAISTLLAFSEMRKIINKPEVAVKKHHWYIETKVNGRNATTSFILKTGRFISLHWDITDPVVLVNGSLLSKTHSIKIDNISLYEEKVRFVTEKLENILIAEFGE